jgi:hypothetical protein
MNILIKMEIDNTTIDDRCIWKIDCEKELKQVKEKKDMPYGYINHGCDVCPGYNPLCELYLGLYEVRENER